MAAGELPEYSLRLGADFSINAGRVRRPADSAWPATDLDRLLYCCFSSGILIE